MKVSLSIGWLVFFGLLIILSTYLIIEYLMPLDTISVKSRGKYDIVTFKLPSSHAPDKFGPSYWKARHKLAEMTPCPACREEAVSHEIFFHDWVNNKTDKKLFNKENYDEWVKRICENKTQIKA